MTDSSEKIPEPNLDIHMPRQRNTYARAFKISKKHTGEAGIGRQLSRMPLLDGRPCVGCSSEGGAVDSKAIVGVRREPQERISIFLCAPEGGTFGCPTSPSSDFGEPRGIEDPKKYFGFKVTLSEDQVAQEVYCWPEGADDWELMDGTFQGDHYHEPDALDFAGICMTAIEWKPTARRTAWAFGTVAVAAQRG